MTFGITETGFVSKRLADIKLEREAELKEALGDAINLLPSSVIGQIVGLQSEREAKLWELAEAVYNSAYPNNSSGVPLDNVVSITGITRQQGVASRATLYFQGTPGTIIPAGSIFSVDGSPTSRFVLDSGITLGASVDEVQTLTFSGVPDAGNFRLQYNNNEDSVLIAYDATSLDVENALNGLSSLSSVVVAGDFSSGFTITFEGDDGGEPHPLLIVLDNTLELSSSPVTTTIVETTAGQANSSAIVFAEVVGEISAPAGSLTVIENPITGLDAVFNNEDAIIGRDIESDADLKLRRAQSLQRAGAGTLGAIVSILADLEGVTAVVGFENITFIELAGRPPKSFEIVIDGSDLATIAPLIWENKPAGIETFGALTEGIIDSQGFPQNVKFSRPTDLDIYVEIDLTTNSDFPSNGLTIAEQAILDFGNALGIGRDIIVYPQLICALNDIPGITDVAIRIGTSAGPTLDDNIIVAANEISRWDSGRTTVIEL